MAVYFVVQTYSACRWGIIPDLPIQVEDEDHAGRLARRLAETKPAVLALANINEAIEIIASYGEVPEAAMEQLSCAC